jgi:hypothetical protein
MAELAMNTATTPPAAGPKAAGSDRFFEAPRLNGIVLDFSPLTRVLADWKTASDPPPVCWLDPQHKWVDPGTGQLRLPVPLCEFAAYRSALVYEAEAVVRRNLGARATDVHFFDSSKSKVADTQGCVFLQDGLAFVVFRGTEPGKVDWTVNLEDRLTDTLFAANKSQISALVARHGPGVGPVLEWLAPRPGRHLGFAIAYGAVHQEIATCLSRLPVGTPVVLTGHSLGGALAQIGAVELAALGYPIAAVITFGAPLVGNKSFADEYAEAGLSPKTVRFESTSDSVPRLLRRWYYRFNRGTQEWISRMIAPPERPPQDVRYAFVSPPLAFEQQPPTSMSEIKGAIEAIVRERAEAAKKHAEAQKKEEAGTSSKVGSGSAKPTGTTGATGQQPAASGPPSQGSGGGGAALWIFGGIALFITVIALWLFYRHKIAAHSITDRYALYLSTLSYQQIRALHADSALPLEHRLAAANDDLSRYLRMTRGETSPSVTFYRDNKLSELPVRLTPDVDLATLDSRSQFIA